MNTCVLHENNEGNHPVVHSSIVQLKGSWATGEAHVRIDWLLNEYYGHFVNPTNEKWTSKRSIIINSTHCFDNNNTYLR